jgi:hypothetical protein
MTINLAHYYDRFDVADHYDRHLFVAGNVLQAAELNEVQSATYQRLQAVTDALFKDGDVLSGAEIVVDETTGDTQLSNGAIYLRGAVRGVPPATFTIPVVGLVKIGVYLQDSVITDLQDPSLRDPAVSFRNYQEPGAARLQVVPTWGYDGDNGTGDFYPVYEVLDGVVVNKTPPPTIDAVAQTIARYDRQSTGGFYVSSGFTITRLTDDEQDRQVYSVTNGSARVGGQEIVKEHASRLVYAAVPDTRSVLMEPHNVSGATGDDMRLDVDDGPIHTVNDVAMVRAVTISLKRGDIAGTSDAFPSNLAPALEIVAISQGVTTFEQGVDFRLYSGKVDWSLEGTEPAPGSTYTIAYQYYDTTTAWTEADNTGFTVPGTVAITVTSPPQTVDAELVNGSLVFVSYTWAMPRYDLICLDQNGYLLTVKGVAAPYRPRVPEVPRSVLALGIIDQRWSSATRVINSGTRMIPMHELNAVNVRIETLFALVAEDRLALNVTQMDSTAKKGVFTDPFLDDDLRDQGLTQTAAIFDGVLTLGVEAAVHSQTLDAPGSLSMTVGITAINQPLRTGSMKVNPYDAFSPLPAVATLAPSIDFWMEFATNWLSPVTRQFSEDIWLNPECRDRSMNRFLSKHPDVDDDKLDAYIRRHTRMVRTEEITQTEKETVGTRYVDAQFLRPIDINFELSGFQPNEDLVAVTFDGQVVNFEEVA